jgi:putative ABC transport system permease protein
VTEIAVRSSMGAGRSRIIRQLATESLVMASIGGLLGLGLGTVGTDLMGKVLASSIPRFWIPAVDGRVVLFTVGVTLLAGLLFGLAPALQTARLNIGAVLKEGGRGASVGGRRRLLAKGLVVAEIALALVLLGGAGVLIRSFLDIQNTDPGFATDRLLTLGLTLPEGSDPAVDRSADVEEVLRRIEALPGVTAAAASSVRPRTPGLPQDILVVDAAPPPEGQAPPSVSYVVTSPGFLETLDIPLAQGRFFGSEDGADTLPVAVINETLARRFWPDQSPIGQRLTLQGRSRQIVGIAGDANHSLFLTSGVPPTVYLPLSQTPRPAVAVTLRTSGDPSLLANPVRQAISGYDRGLVVTQVQTLDEYEAQFYVGMQLFTAILGGFGSLALLLAALGTYGVLAYAVAQRSHEIGVRMAIGARRSQVMGMVARQGLLLAAIGIALGIPGVLGVTRVISGALSDFVAVEPATVIGMAAVLAVVTLLASWMPARKAANVDPVVALRMD